jgi:methionine aminopeptidase
MDLIDKTREALNNAIALCKPGVEFKMIGDAIRYFIESTNSMPQQLTCYSETADGKYGISEDFCGHGIGKTLTD